MADSQIMEYVIGLILGIGALILGTKAYRAYRRYAAKHGKFNPDWKKILLKNVPLYHRLPDHHREELHSHVAVFLEDKNFVGRGGLEITEEIQVTVAGQACFLLLNRKVACYPKVSTVIMYPQAYAAKTLLEGPGGVTEEGVQYRAGESWESGVVVLSWDHAWRGAADIHDGHNVVLHEFAHQVDQEDGSTDGTPILPNRLRYTAWAKVFQRDFEIHQKKTTKGKKTTLDPYAATNPAEFFAVATETFFEKPQSLKTKHPALFEELKQFFQVNPLLWKKS